MDTSAYHVKSGPGDQPRHYDHEEKYEKDEVANESQGLSPARNQLRYRTHGISCSKLRVGRRTKAIQ